MVIKATVTAAAAVGAPRAGAETSTELLLSNQSRNALLPCCVIHTLPLDCTPNNCTISRMTSTLVFAPRPRLNFVRLTRAAVLDQLKLDEALMRASFPGYEVLDLRTYEAEVAEGTAHSGMSGLVGFVGIKPGA